jgi:hypothetical protein
MPSADATPVIVHAIQLAVAPVFLLTGIAALIGVMATRLARIIDRARHLDESWDGMSEQARETARTELVDLERRRHLASWAINLSTSAALLVCMVVATLFIEEFFGAEFKSLAGLMFVVATLVLIGGLVCFLREVYVATHTVRILTDRFRR